MPAQSHTRVAVYLDFDNMVISRYDQLHGREAWRHDNARDHAAGAAGQSDSSPIAAKLTAARVDVGAIIDYASSFGTVALTRAYADWSVPANAAYKSQLVTRSVGLTQLFPVSGTKNGADIELVTDALMDLVQHEDLTHVVIAAGDSDFIPLARRCKQMGRYVVGIGVSGSTSRALINACDEFRQYDKLPGVPSPTPTAAEATSLSESNNSTQKSGKTSTARGASKKATAAKKAEDGSAKSAGTTSGTSSGTSSGASSGKAAKTAAKTTKATDPKAKAASKPDDNDAQPPSRTTLSAAEQEAVDLLRRAVSLAQDRSDDEWLHGGGLKSQMQRMDPGFKEKELGYKSFTDFVQAHPQVVATRTDGSGHLLLKLAGH